MKKLLLAVVCCFVALPLFAVPDGMYSYEFFDEEGNSVGTREVWCSGVSTTGTTTENYIVLYWGPCETMEPWMGCEDAAPGWVTQPGECEGFCFSAGQWELYDLCLGVDCLDQYKSGCTIRGKARRQKMPDRAAIWERREKLRLATQPPQEPRAEHAAAASHAADTADTNCSR